MTALGMACAHGAMVRRPGHVPGLWDSAVRSRMCHVRVGLMAFVIAYLSLMIESENAAALQHNKTVSSCSSSSSLHELCVCVLEFAGIVGGDISPAILPRHTLVPLSTDWAHTTVHQ